MKKFKEYVALKIQNINLLLYTAFKFSEDQKTIFKNKKKDYNTNKENYKYNLFIKRAYQTKIIYNL